MSILNKLTIKHLLMNKKRTIVSIIGIMLSTALMVGIGLICSSVREMMIEETIKSNGSFNASIEDVPIDKLDIVDYNKNIDEYFYEYNIGYANYEDSNNEFKPYFYIAGVSNNFFNELSMISGETPKNSDEIVLSQHVYEQGNGEYKVGDYITLDYGRRVVDGEEITNTTYIPSEKLIVEGSKTYKIVGICERSKYESYSSSGFYIFTKADENINKKVKLYMVYNNPEDSYELTELIYKNLGMYNEEDPFRGIDYNNSLLALYGESSYDNYNRFISEFLILFLSIISVACIIVIYNSFAISVMERKKQFGLFSSIGATKLQLMKTVFFEAFIVGGIGIILGIASAYIGIGTVAYIINSLLVDLLDGLAFSLTTYPLFIIIPIIFMIIVVIISAFIPSLRASRISPIEVIRQNDDIKINKRKIKTSGLVNKLFGIEGIIALKNIKRNKKKYRITIASLFISIVTFIAFSSYLVFGFITVDEYSDNVDYDVSINTPVSKEYDEFLRGIANNTNVLKSTQFKFLVVQTRIIKDKFLSSEYIKYFGSDKDDISGDSYINDYINIVSLSKEDYDEYKEELGIDKDTPILVNNYTHFTYEDSSRTAFKLTPFNENLSLTLCNYKKISSIYEMDRFREGNFYEKDAEDLLVNSCSYNLKDFYFTNKYPELLSDLSDYRGVLIVNEDMFNDIFAYHTEGAVNVRLASSILVLTTDDYSEFDRMSKTFYDDIFYSNYAKELQSTRNLIFVVKLLLYGFISLVTLIGVTSVFNTICTSINLRKREFSVLRSVGLTPKGFNKMIFFESLFFGIKSLIYALPVGIFLSYLIASNMNNLVEFKYSLPMESILISIAGVFIIVLITMWYSVRKIKKDNILEAIREENI